MTSIMYALGSMCDFPPLESCKARSGISVYVRVEWNPIRQHREGEQCLPDSDQSGLTKRWVSCMDRCWYRCRSDSRGIDEAS